METNVLRQGVGMNFHWDAKYSVGVPSIDDQHKPIVDILNELHKPSANINMESASQRILDYTKSHFAFEENLMIQHQYPGYLQHKAQHDKFVNMILAYLGTKDDSSAKSMAKMILVRWFMEHITSNVMDRKLGVFLTEKGIL